MFKTFSLSLSILAVLCASARAITNDPHFDSLTVEKPLAPASGGTGGMPLLNPIQFGAACDGATDDSAALVAWAAAAVNGAYMVVPGTCLFKSSLVFPAGVNYVRLTGGTLLYAGDSTNITAVKVGDPGHGVCEATGWSISGLRIKSSTPMTGGEALLLGDVCHFDINDLHVGGQFGDDNGNWFIGVHGAGGNSIHLRGLFARASNTAEVINGDVSVQLTDWFQDHATIVKSGLGLDIAGNVGGFVMNSGDIVGNGANVRVTQDQIQVANHQVFFGSAVAIDGTDLTSYPSGTGIGIELTDPGSGSYLLFGGTWLSYASNQCAKIDTTASSWHILMSGGTVITCGSGGALSTGAFDNESTSSSVQIQFSGTRFGLNNGQDIFNVSGAQPIALLGVTFDSAGYGKVTGQSSSALVDPSGNLRLASNGGLFLKSGASMLLSPPTANAIVLGPGGGSNCAVWAESGAMIPGRADATTGGCAYTIGSVGFPFSSAYLSSLYSPSNLTLTAASGALVASASSNVSLQAAASSTAILGAGSTSSQCGLGVQSGSVLPFFMDGSASGCVAQLGSATSPFDKVIANTAQAKFVQLVGAAPAASGSCAIKNQSAGASAGLFQLTSSCAGASVILTFGLSAPTGWLCSTQAMTQADSIRQAGFTPTSATFTVTGSANDYFGVSCTGV
jgi:hypothetical protein